ncbi:hypothetical protein R6V09_20605 [Streptomyces sp. W16]|uniref:hypothetical protein n=1 Tax=Streptomyces sp. W16 TaxID=3076631 RepID=UPI00295A64A4|nr:hypothetical protein [Streptomyces sp. W16]MDV9172495.1 hypothetical protein [Streptomyces sp. W16]
MLSRARDGYRDMLRGYAVLIDDTQVGIIRRGQTVRFEVPPGEHRLQLKVAWCTSRPLTALVEEGGTVSFMCAPGGDASEALAAVSVDKDDYITLQQTSEPIVMTKTPMDRGTRLSLATTFGLFAGGITLTGALIWHYTGVAPKADNAVAGVSLAVTLISTIAFRLRRWKAGRHPRT